MIGYVANMQKKVTVFTPTYNRAKLLPRLYKSLLKQSNKNFEWIVVDDGSNDNTGSLFDCWIGEADFTIIYRQQINGGKHRAINRGVGLASGDLFFIVDSDDWLREDAIEKILQYEISLPIGFEKKYSGVCGQRVHPNSTLVGTTFVGEYLDSFTYENEKNHITGDKSEVFYLNVLKKYPFPEIEGENFCPEALVWNRISADGYIMRYFNEGIYYCDYQQDGLTSKIDKLLIDNIKSYLLYSKELINNSHYSFVTRMHCIANVARRGLIRGYSYKQLATQVGAPISLLFCGNIVSRVFFLIRRMN